MRLDLSNNNIATIDTVGGCSNLKWLNISKNNIASLNALSSLEKLEVLNAAQNALEGKVTVGRLRSLKALVLNGNELQLIGGLEKLDHLETLILSQNKVESLGGWLGGATALQKLSISHNPVGREPSSTVALKSLTNMRELRLNHCQLHHIPKEIKYMKRLKILELGSNDIDDIDELGILSSVTMLWQLNLKGCPLTNTAGYRERVLKYVPGLDVLDTKRLRPKQQGAGKDCGEEDRDVVQRAGAATSNTAKQIKPMPAHVHRQSNDDYGDVANDRDGNSKDDDDDDAIRPEEFVASLETSKHDNKQKGGIVHLVQESKTQHRTKKRYRKDSKDTHKKSKTGGKADTKTKGTRGTKVRGTAALAAVCSSKTTNIEAALDGWD